MSNKGPLVSILVNCYNGEKFLSGALESIISQTYSNWEVIFWDNQSSDKSAEIFKGYVDPRFRYFCSPKHTKLYEARGMAFKHVRGRLLAFLDVDDIWSPDKLFRQVPLFEDPEVGMCCGNFMVENQNTNKSWEYFKSTRPSGYVLDELLKDFYVGLLTLMVRVDAIKGFDPIFDPRYHIIGDFDLVFKLAHEWKLGCLQQVVACYRIHGANETSLRSQLQVEELDSWLKDVEERSEITSSKNFCYAKSRIAYISGIHYVLAGERTKALNFLSKIKGIKSKLRLIFGVIVPRNIAKSLKN